MNGESTLTETIMTREKFVIEREIPKVGSLDASTARNWSRREVSRKR